MLYSSQNFLGIVLLWSISLGANLVLTDDQSTSEYVPDKLEGDGPFDCWHYAMRAAKSILKTFGKCSKEVKANATSPKDFSEKLGCVVKCTMRRINFTTPDHQITHEQLSLFIRKFFNNEKMVEEFLNSIESSCIAKQGLVLDVQDEYCMSYSDLAACLQSSLGDLVEKSAFCIKKPKKTIEDVMQT